MNQSEAFSKKGMLGGFIIVWSTLYVRHLFPVIYSVRSKFPSRPTAWNVVAGSRCAMDEKHNKVNGKGRCFMRIGWGRGSRLVGCESKIYGICTKNLGF